MTLTIALPEMPEDPEPGAVFLQELVVDLAEALEAEARWEASITADGILLDCAVGARTFGFSLVGEPDGMFFAIEAWDRGHGCDVAGWLERVRRVLAADDRVVLVYRIGR